MEQNTHHITAKENRKNSKYLGSMLKIVKWIILIGLSIFIITAILSGMSKSNQRSDEVLNDVTTVINSLDSGTRVSIATTAGRAGDITKVNSAISNDVRIDISTYLETPDEGKIIARNIFNVICRDVPELDSLYVTGGNGLDSYSIYRSESACK